jgi:RecB family exonuclease
MLQPGRWPERHALARLAPSFARGIAATRRRRGKRLSEFDGLIRRDADRRPRRTSPTALQTWATCPFLYFLRHVLGVSEREEPETVLVLSAAERGTLIHEVLDAFVKANDGWHEPWNDAKRDELLAFAEAAFAQKEAQGLTGKPLLWHLERDRIRRDLDGFLRADADRSEKTGFYFLRGEHSFGDPGGGAAEVSVPLDDGTSIAFRGRIDRVDRDVSGRLAVYDYKTGSTSTYKEMDSDPTKAGQLLQLPVYALAAREAFGSADSDIDAFYWFVTRKGEYELKPAGENADQMPRFGRQLQLIADGIERGLFPANPGAATWRPGKSSYENCVYCPYDRLCQQDRHRAWGRKQTDERLAGYLKLAETEDVVADE